MGLLRPIWLFHDPYNSKNTWHRAAAYLLVDTGFPCITTAFAVLFLALLRATQVNIICTRFTVDMPFYRWLNSFHISLYYISGWAHFSIFSNTASVGGLLLDAFLCEHRCWYHHWVRVFSALYGTHLTRNIHCLELTPLSWLFLHIFCHEQVRLRSSSW